MTKDNKQDCAVENELSQYMILVELRWITDFDSPSVGSFILSDWSELISLNDIYCCKL
jgi:hypothetical protein